MDDLAYIISVKAQKFVGLIGAFSAFGVAILARIYSHAEDSRSNNKPFWTRDLIFELIGALFCGLVAQGIGEYLSLGATATCALAAIAGRIGPKGLIELVTRFVPTKK